MALNCSIENPLSSRLHSLEFKTLRHPLARLLVHLQAQYQTFYFPLRSIRLYPMVRRLDSFPLGRRNFRRLLRLLQDPNPVAPLHLLHWVVLPLPSEA